FAVEVLARGIRDFDDAGVFVTFEETPTDIRRNAASLGLPIERWEAVGRWPCSATSNTPARSSGPSP
ncbi:ATPase domain-containing protein, partial [Saccharopolyspora sp. NPDC002686]|uniref:ATPase domain-containing protein n=1 Tax=Saccharopolyspora sp. NPDC002686 TaxID=3154541 RepID=UPI0033296FE7